MITAEECLAQLRKIIEGKHSHDSVAVWEIRSALAYAEEGNRMNERPKDAPEWIWFGESNGQPVVTFGRWPKHGAKWRYKWAEIQATEHDHPKRCPAIRQVFEIVLAALNYDGLDIDSLTVGEIRRALP